MLTESSRVGQVTPRNRLALASFESAETSVGRCEPGPPSPKLGWASIARGLAWTRMSKTTTFARSLDRDHHLVLAVRVHVVHHPASLQL
jgi:hypothetical protein